MYDLNHQLSRTTPEQEAKLTGEISALAREFPGHDFLGHGTRREAAAAIINEGLFFKGGGVASLLSTAIPLNPANDAAGTTAMIKQWPHYNLKTIVLLCLPPHAHVPGDCEWHAYIEANRSKTSYLDTREFRVPENYVLGVINADTMEFQRNPQFMPRPGPIDNSIWDEIRKARLFNRPSIAARGDANNPFCGMRLPATPASSNENANPDDWID